MHMVTGWRYWYRRCLTWIPIQFCFVCGKIYWAGLPRWSIEWVSLDSLDHKQWYPNTNCRRRIVSRWLPGWKDYCSEECANEDEKEIL